MTLAVAGAVALSVAICIGIGTYANPAYPRADMVLRKIVQTQIQHGEFVITDYAKTQRAR